MENSLKFKAETIDLKTMSEVKGGFIIPFSVEVAQIVSYTNPQKDFVESNFPFRIEYEITVTSEYD